MITAKRLMALLEECPPDAQVFAYEGEDTGMTIQFQDGSRRWIRAGQYDELDDYTEGFEPPAGDAAAILPVPASFV
jgi:hypothetical protein